MNIFHEALYRPLFNLLIWFYNVIPGQDIGFAIIAISIIVKGILWPFSRVSLKSQKALQDIQPKIDALKESLKDDKEKLAKAMMELYKEEKVNPFSSCLPLIIQLPVLITLYQVLGAGLNSASLVALYPFVTNPGSIDPFFLNSIDLSKPYIIMAIIAGIFQFLQTRMLITSRPPKNIEKKPGAADEAMLANMNKMMLYFMPVMTVMIGISLPGGLVLYWIVINLLSILQQALVFRKKKQADVIVIPAKK